MSSVQPISNEAADVIVKRGLKIPPQGVNGYDKQWYPICLASDVKPGEVIRREFMNGRVIIYRGESGQAHVLSAFCRHLGADLAVGTVIGDNVRCAFHHWSYDGTGACVHIACGDTPPKDAKLFNFPTTESLGVIWAFNGHEPDMDLPHFSIAEADLEYRPIVVKDMNVDTYMVFSNSMDFQHLKVVHGVDLLNDLENMEITDRTMSYVQNMKIPGLGKIRQGVKIWGTNSIALEGETMGRASMAMSAGCPLPGNRARIYSISATPKASGKPGEAQMVPQILQIMEDFNIRLIEEDAPVHDTMSFRHDRMAESDKYLSIFLRYARTYPRTNPAEDLIAV